MIVARFFLAIIFLGLLGNSYGFLFDRCRIFSSSIAMESFDFSSAKGWDEFYKTENQDQILASQDGSSSAGTASTTEWHPSVSLEDIASLVPPNGKCLIIGCGNSNLPDVILQQSNRPPPSSLVLLDTSQTCLTQLQERHQRIEISTANSAGKKSQVTLSNTEIDYVCGDVTKLSNYFAADNMIDSYEIEGKPFDIIIDKGLTDALLCGEGWDGPLEKLLQESAKVLSIETGQYLLISYDLPSSTKEFLVDIGDKVGLEWGFDFDLGAARSSHHDDGVSVAMATRKSAPNTIS